MAKMIKFVIIAGISGAGKGEAAKCFKDMEYHHVVNLPPSLLPEFVRTCINGKSKRKSYCLVLDTGEVGLSNGVFSNLKKLSEIGIDYKLIFLDASDEVIKHRYEKTGRPHPWGRRRGLLENIKIERRYLEGLRKEANLVIDTSEFTLQDIRLILEKCVVDNRKEAKMTISGIGKDNILPEVLLSDERRRIISPILDSLESIETGDGERLSNLLGNLAKFVGFEIKKQVSAQQIIYFKIDIERMRIKMKKEDSLFMVVPEINKDIISNIENIIRREKVQNDISFIIADKDSTKLKQWVKNSAYQLVVLNKEDLKKVFSAYDSKKAFIKCIVEQIGLRQVSPYCSLGPTKNFYGRQKEIKELMENKGVNYTIVGGRRMGKTSLLLKVKKEMEKNGDSKVIFIDCSICRDYEDFFSLVCHRLEIPTEEIKDMLSFFRYFSVKNERVIFLLDEIDNLIDIDKKNGYLLISALRDLAFNGYCRCIMAGFKVLYFQTKDIDSPLYHFTKSIHLSVLDKPGGENLIREPMGNLGVSFIDPIKNIDKILNLVSLHPSCIQAFCEKLIESLSKSNNRIVSDSLINRIYMDSNFERDLLNIFLPTFDKDNLKRSIIFNIINMKPPISFETIHHTLKNEGIVIKIDEVDKDMDNLILLGVLDKNGKEYSFLFDRLPTIIKNNIERKYILKESLKEGII
ncbi:MAG: RNase adapter RapZ [bacterium]